MGDDDQSAIAARWSAATSSGLEASVQVGFEFIHSHAGCDWLCLVQVAVCARFCIAPSWFGIRDC